ncbi:MAG: glycosyltransferase family 9 protein [Candidatus Mcinerneyibacterium aminivorans]|uniref:Glycosyltransferase family 9 protein n=1 Tax=Candidatus Mcinerneyibacterium aminivorans TaxID=2703815 RepID=A0A5D0MIW9_9BACT|nr:MAG: glycosyltransferase family 9 protein [Candidatus Mcinerneyibacterium aminivorans]
MKNIDNLLIVKLSSMGDVLMNIPVVEGIKKSQNDVRLGWVVEDKASDLLKHYKSIDKLYVFNKTQVESYYRNFNYVALYRYIKKFIKKIRKDSWTNSLDLQWVFRSSIIPWLAGIRNRYGCIGNGLHKIFISNNYKLNHSKLPAHVIRKNFRIVQKMGFINKKLTPNCFFPLSGGLKNWAGKKVKAYDGYFKIGIAPFSKWNTKNWSVNKYNNLIEKTVKKEEYAVFLFGGEEDRIKVNKMLGIENKRVVDFTGKINLNEFAALAFEMDLFISGDSFPMHVASFLNIPQIAIFGPTSPKKTGPLNKKAHIIQRNFDCIPCFSKTCLLEKNKHKCLENISENEMMEIIENIKKSLE